MLEKDGECVHYEYGGRENFNGAYEGCMLK